MDTAQFFKTVVKNQPKTYLALRIEEVSVIPTPKKEPEMLVMPPIIIKEIVIPKKTIPELLYSSKVKLVGSYDAHAKVQTRAHASI